jgi:hypothetical protein
MDVAYYWMVCEKMLTRVFLCSLNWLRVGRIGGVKYVGLVYVCMACLSVGSCKSIQCRILHGESLTRLICMYGRVGTDASCAKAACCACFLHVSWLFGRVLDVC